MDELEKVAIPVTSLIARHLSGNKIGNKVATDWLQRLPRRPNMGEFDGFPT